MESRDDTRPSCVLLRGGRVIDGLGGVHDDWSILVEGERIAAAGPGLAGLAPPPGAIELNIAGQTVFPGLFDMHGHMYARAHTAIKGQLPAYPLLYLAGGVTTVRDPGELDPEAVETLRANVQLGRALGPRVFTAGPYFDHTTSGVSWIKGTDDPAQALSMFDSWRHRIDMVKVYSSITEAQFVALERAAHSEGLPVVGHLGSLTAGRAIELGINGLEHGLFTMSEFRPVTEAFTSIERLDMESPGVTRLLETIVRHKVTVCPTIITFQYNMDPEFTPLTPDWLDYFSTEARATQEERASKRRSKGPDETLAVRRALDKQLQFTGMVHAMGGIVVAGTDPVGPALTPGWGIHRELENLVAAGLTPLAAIRAATYDSARVLGVDQNRGSIGAGKLADLVIVDGDPSTDISHTRRTRLVMLGGVIHDPVSLRNQARGQIT